MWRCNSDHVPAGCMYAIYSVTSSDISTTTLLQASCSTRAATRQHHQQLPGATEHTLHEMPSGAGHCCSPALHTSYHTGLLMRHPRQLALPHSCCGMSHHLSRTLAPSPGRQTRSSRGSRQAADLAHTRHTCQGPRWLWSGCTAAHTCSVDNTAQHGVTFLSQANLGVGLKS